MKKVRLLHKVLSLLLVCIIGFNCIGCKGTVHAKNLMEDVTISASVEIKEADKEFINAQMNFALEFFKESVAQGENENVLISPLSLMLALSMTANGADGQTRAEMERVLANTGVEGELAMSVDTLNQYLKGYVDSLPTGDKYKLKIANSIWFKDKAEKFTVEQEFLQKNASYYNAQVYKSDFEAGTIKDINNWVKNNTDGMIDDIIKEIDEKAVMYLINALAFEAEWEDVYYKEDVFDGKFTAVDGVVRDVKMMASNEWSYIKTGNSTGFIKDYKDEKYSFVALLPNEGIGIKDYISSMKYNELLEVMNNAESRKVDAFTPKFSYEYSVLGQEILREMGMTTAFDVNSANFSEMGKVEGENIYIGNVIHKTYISVEEKGTKAGAATMVGMLSGSAMPQETPQVRLDRPFVYLIIDNSTSLPIFMGVVTDIKK